MKSSRMCEALGLYEDENIPVQWFVICADMLRPDRCDALAASCVGERRRGSAPFVVEFAGAKPGTSSWEASGIIGE